MAIQRFSQGFKDISLSFSKHPVTRDILALKNEDAIKRSVQNLVRIHVGETVFNPLLGTRVTDALFELADDTFIDPIKTEVELVLSNWEPRITLQDVDVVADPDNNSLEVTINYDLVGLSAPTQSISFVLAPTRL